MNKPLTVKELIAMLTTIDRMANDNEPMAVNIAVYFQLKLGSDETEYKITGVHYDSSLHGIWFSLKAWDHANRP